MKNYKSVVCLFSIICLALILCACGGNTAKDDSSVDTDNADSKYFDEYGNPILVELEGEKLTAENVVSTGWQCTYNSGDDKIYTRFTLEADATYKQIIAINGLFDHSETGTYEVKNGKLYLYLNGDSASGTVYEYKNGNLFNSGNEFTPYFE